MTEDRCLSAEALSGHRDWPREDVRRTHLESCGRCQALLTSLDRFETEPSDLPAAPLADARARLARARRGWPAAGTTGVAGSADARPSPDATREPALPLPLRTARRWTEGWPAANGWQGWRPALAAAALVVIAASAWWAGRELYPGRPGLVLRAGEEPTTRQARLEVRLLPVEHDANGGRLRWSTLPGADAYEVVLLDEAFAALGHHAAGTDTALALAVLERAAGPAAARAAYWQVIALQAGDVLAESPPAPLGRTRAR